MMTDKNLTNPCIIQGLGVLRADKASYGDSCVRPGWGVLNEIGKAGPSDVMAVVSRKQEEGHQVSSEERWFKAGGTRTRTEVGNVLGLLEIQRGSQYCWTGGTEESERKREE